MSETPRWKMSIVGEGMEDPRLLLPHPLNPKIHPAEQDAVVEASLRELGWLERVIKNVTTGHLLDGHERVALAIARHEPAVPVSYVQIPAEDEGKALMLLDPSGQLARTHVQRWAQLQREARTDESVLRAFFASQVAQGVEASQQEASSEGRHNDGTDTGAGESGESLFVERGTVLQGQWETAPGQLWTLGPHYVWVGDSTEADGWQALRERVGQVQGCVTSPPYAEQRAQAYGGVPVDGYAAWFRSMTGHLRTVLAGDGSLFLNLKEHSDGIARPVYVHELVVQLVREEGWVYLDEFCWERHGVPGSAERRGKFKNMWEPVFWFARQVRPVFHPERVMHRSARGIVDRDYQPGLVVAQGSGRDFLGDEGRRGPGWASAGNRLPSFGNAEALGQPAAYPIGLAQFFAEVYSERGDWWVDPFGGTGSTLMACEASGRRCWMQERAPGYVAITLERYRQATGVTPKQVVP